MKYFVTVLLFLTILSCETNRYEFTSKPKTLNEAIINEINQGFEDDNLFKVFQLITYYDNQESDFLSDSKERLFRLLPLKLKDHYEKAQWNDFFITYNNLKTLGFDLKEYDYNHILYNYLVSNIEDNLMKAGVFLGEEKLDYTRLSNKELETLYSVYKKVTPDFDFPKLLAIDSIKKIHIEEKSSNFVDGVFTVYVNRGVTFKNGIGTNDVMIGSGFFIDKKGYAITNYHVIDSLVDPEYEGVANLYVKLNDSMDRVPAKVVGWDKVLDLALLKVTTVPKYIYSLSTEDSVQIGDTVIALGSPGGLGSTVTSGIVSAKDRTLLELGSVIQIDSPINPGNSGGPLIDENKKVTNVVFAGIEQFEGVNFAIPAKYLKKKLFNLYRGGKIKHVWLGAGLTYRKNRLEVIYTKPNSPSYFLGLEKGDIIKSINSIEFNSIIEIQDYLMNFSPFEIITLEFERDREIISKKICLEERPKIPMESILNGDSSDHLYTPLFGMDIRFTGKILWNKEYQITDVFPGTIADELDLASGDIIEVKNWEYNEEHEVVILQLIIQSKSEGFWKKVIQVTSPINVNFFI